MIEKYNIFKEIPIDKSEEKFFEIFKNENIKIEKIVSNGQKSPDNFWYEQEKSEYILLLSGYAILEFEDFEIELFKGDCLNIEAFITPLTNNLKSQLAYCTFGCLKKLATF